MSENTTQMVTIDGKEYEVDSIPEEVKTLIVLFNKANEQLTETRMQLQIYDAACASYAGLISAKMKAFNDSDAEIVVE